ncbi:MAG TPA: DUF5752 family protein [Terriglobales bacterium]|jgi:hypothetical protein|nr:DUF5752 family protein [Terriglobales bacterium]
MATAEMSVVARRQARAPFHFNSAAHLIRIGREKASNLSELLSALKACPDESIFQHTFQTLREHHFIREGFSNDFAHWAFAACNEVGLAERLAGIDIREFMSIAALRQRLVDIVESYLQQNPRGRDRAAFEPFYFSASEVIVIPTPFVARDLAEFAEGIRHVSLTSIHFHFIDARLRLRLNSNDFSLWLEHELDLGRLAERINRIDIYTSTLDDVRRAILRFVQTALVR